MILTRRVDYALRALLDLAWRPHQLILQRDIAHRQGIPEKYLEQILRGLKTAGLVTATRGAKGGYQLAAAPAEINLIAVLEAIGGPLTREGEGEPEPGLALLVHVYWDELSAAWREQLAEITLASFIQRYEAGSPYADSWVI